jgi:hypothetical protein
MPFMGSGSGTSPFRSVTSEVKKVIPIDPGFPNRIPTATTDLQVRGLIEKARLEERERCIKIVQSEIAKWDSQYGVGWSWDKVRDKILAAVRSV